MAERKITTQWGKLSETHNDCLNTLFAQNNFTAMAQYMKMYDLWNEENREHLLKTALRLNSEQAVALLHDWEFQEQDFINIAVDGDVKCFEAALRAAEDFQRPKLAAALFNTNFVITGLAAKLISVIKYRAFSSEFWETMLSNEDNNEYLEFAVRKMVSWINDKPYELELKIVENKIIMRNKESQLRIIAPYLTDEGWQKLSVEQIRICNACYPAAPDSFISHCIFKRKSAEFSALIELRPICDDLVMALLTLNIFDMFSSYVKLYPLPIIGEKLLFSKKYKEYRREYLKYQKIPFLRKIAYLLD